jgi:outer membrane protein assembly factor BamA
MIPQPRWLAIATFVGCEITAGLARGTEADSTQVADRSDTVTSAAPEPRARTRIIPLPLYATLPNEGNTYGVLPVFLRVDPEGRTTSITAPSVSWNTSAGVNTTFRYYDVASQVRSWSVIAAIATHVNRSLRFQYQDTPGERGQTTLEIQAIARRSLFFRYFGLGPDSDSADQSSYTRSIALLSTRYGMNVVRYLNAGARAGIRGDWPERHAISGLPETQDRFPDARGLGGAALATIELSLRLDTRNQGDYDRRGVASELHLARQFGLDHSDSFWQFTWHTRVLVPEASFLTGAVRLYVTDELGGDDVPFYYRSTLGGDTLFRGYSDDRFIDRGAWEAEMEQRFRLFQTHLFGVVADWRIDPFFAIGQVYSRLGTLTSHVRPAGGVGFRAWVHPNVLGRVDVAYASDGVKAYVMLGYPY